MKNCVDNPLQHSRNAALCPGVFDMLTSGTGCVKKNNDMSIFWSKLNILARFCGGL